MKSEKNITRIVTGIYEGWEVRIQRRGKKYEKYFGDRKYGGKTKAMKAARAYRNEILAATSRYSVAELAKKPSVRNNSGVVGVRLHKQVDTRGDYQYEYWYYVAQWTDAKGRRRTKSFSVHTHGEDKALKLAKKARREGVAAAGR